MKVVGFALLTAMSTSALAQGIEDVEPKVVQDAAMLLVIASECRHLKKDETIFQNAKSEAEASLSAAGLGANEITNFVSQFDGPHDPDAPPITEYFCSRLTSSAPAPSAR